MTEQLVLLPASREATPAPASVPETLAYATFLAQYRPVFHREWVRTVGSNPALVQMEHNDDGTVSLFPAANLPAAARTWWCRKEAQHG
jgi:hypothetical protein